MENMLSELLKGKHVDQRQSVGYVFPQTGASWMTLPSLLRATSKILQALEYTVSWERMKFKPNTSRWLVIRKGQVKDKIPYTGRGNPITERSTHKVHCQAKDDMDSTRHNYQASTMLCCTSMVCTQDSSGRWLFTRFQQLQQECSNVPWANNTGDELVFRPVSLTLDSTGRQQFWNSHFAPDRKSSRFRRQDWS